MRDVLRFAPSWIYVIEVVSPFTVTGPESRLDPVVVRGMAKRQVTVYV